MLEEEESPGDVLFVLCDEMGVGGRGGEVVLAEEEDGVSEVVEKAGIGGSEEERRRGGNAPG